MPSLRRARRHALLLGALAALAVLSPATSSARVLGGDVARQEERLHAREEREKAREQRRAEHALAREERHKAREERRAGREAGRTSHGEGEGEGTHRRTDATPGESTRCAVTASSSSSQITLGEDVTVTGTLSCPEGESASGKTLTAFRSGQGSRTEDGTATTEPDGSYSITVSGLQTNSTLQVRDGRAHSARLRVKVAPWVTVSDPAAGSALASHVARAGHSTTSRTSFSGTVDPRFAGRRVALQTSFDATGGQWRTVALGQVADDGSYTVSHPFRTAGQVWVRVLLRPGSANVPGASEPVSYEVTATQNPALTIESSVPSAPFGTAVTITGTTGAPATPVQLYWRSRSGAFQPLTSGTSDESGRYSFPVTPTQTGFYEVRDATASSIAIFQHVSFALTLATPPATAVTGEEVTLTGTLEPAPAGVIVQLERQWKGVNFRPVATGTVSGTAVSIAHTFAAAGSYVLRVRVLGADGVESASSAPFTIQVTAAA